MRTLLVSLLLLTGCATLKAAKPKLVICVQTAYNDLAPSAIQALEAQDWMAALDDFIIQAGDAGACAIKAIAEAQVASLPLHQARAQAYLMSK